MTTEPRGNRCLSWPVWIAYLLLVVIAVPWYWPDGDRTIVAGMPAWVAVAVLASVLISGLTAYLLRHPWPEEEEDDEAGEEARPWTS